MKLFLTKILIADTGSFAILIRRGSKRMGRSWHEKASQRRRGRTRETTHVYGILMCQVLSALHELTCSVPTAPCLRDILLLIMLLQMRKLSHGEVRKPAQGHSGRAKFWILAFLVQREDGPGNKTFLCEWYSLKSACLLPSLLPSVRDKEEFSTEVGYLTTVLWIS